MKFNNRVPQDFFCASGVGHSDVAINAGSLQQARQDAGIADCNLLFYNSSFLPIGAKEVKFPSREMLPYGSVLESVIASAHAREGERATAAIVYAHLRHRELGHDCGGIICEYSGALPEDGAKKELERMFLDIYEESYQDQYEYEEMKFIVKSALAEKRYVSVFVSICFLSGSFQEQALVDCDRPFLGMQSLFDEAKNILIPVAFDSTSSWLKGSKFAPRAILHASTVLEDFNIETGSVVSKHGFHTMTAISKEEPEKMLDHVERHVSRAIKHGKTPCVIGGNHSVTIGAFRAVHAEYPDVSILHLDAHTDYRDMHQGSKYSHSCVMRRLSEKCENIVSVGIRSTSLEERSLLKMEKIFYAADLMKDEEEWFDEILHQLDPDVYITCDLDVFDPKEMPAVSTPAPGGLSWSFINGLIKKVAKHHNIVGFDVVELCPNRYLRAADFSAAQLIYNTFAYVNHYKK
ncbi:MAG: agmatinase [Chlamydiae bacterium]|nr:agmatinase [Chlamydiota bacterium]